MAKITIGRRLNRTADSVNAFEQNQLVTEPHDYIQLGYTAGVLTSAVYRQGGVSGTIVATLTLVYDVDGNLETVERT